MLKINQLQINYGQKTVLKQVQFQVEAGEIVGILGMNGAGKTTLFRAIYGHLIPVKGQVLWQQQSIATSDISFLETTNYFYPFLRGEEYLRLLHPNNELDTRYQKIFNLPLNDLIETYSTGMKKSLAFWGNLLLDRPILILDEPFNGVDLERVEHFHFLIQQLQESGKIILISSHILETLTRICNRILFLSDGEIRRTYEQSSFDILEKDLRQLIRNKLSNIN